MPEPNEIVFSVERYENCLIELDGCSYDGERTAEAIGPDFATLEEAESWVREQAGRDKLRVFLSAVDTGGVTRSVYTVTAMRYDADEQEWALCRPDGSDAEVCGDEQAFTLDVLNDLHPEVRNAWDKACRRRGLFDLFLDDELGTGWESLGFIEVI